MPPLSVSAVTGAQITSLAVVPAGCAATARRHPMEPTAASDTEKHEWSLT